MATNRARTRNTTRRLMVVSSLCFAVGFAGAALLRRPPTSPAEDPSATPPAPPSPATARSSTPPPARDLAAAEKRFQAGFRLLEREQVSEALEEFKVAARLDPTDPRPHHGMGQVYQKMVLVDRAETAYREALAIDPTFDHSKKSLAALLYERGRYEEATRLLEELRARRPKDTFVWAELALNSIALDRPARAIELLERYNAARGPQAWGFTHLGRAYEATGDLEKAEASYREALAIDPRYTLAYYSLGQLLSAKGEEEESGRLLKTHQQLRDLETRAHELRLTLLRDSNNVGALMGLSQVLYRLGKGTEALSLIARARTLRPGDASIQSIYEKVKRTVAAAKERAHEGR